MSRALRGDEAVAASTRQRVILAAERLGYVSSDRGRSLSTRRTDRLGVVIEDLHNPFYLELLAMLHEQLERAHVRTTVLTSNGDDFDGIERLVDGSIDGVVLTTTLLDSPLPGLLEARRFPFVLVNRIIDAPSRSSCSVNNHAGAAMMAAELLHHGHSLIAAIFGPENTSTGRDREAGFREALRRHETHLPEERVRRGAFSYATGHRAMSSLLDVSPRPTALFCSNDVVAIGALNAAAAASLLVPRDISIVGFDDIEMASWDVFRLTTIRQDIAKMSQIAIDILLARIADDETPEQQIVLPPELIMRSTLGPPAY